MKKNIIIGVASIVLAFGAIIGLANGCAPKSDISQEAATIQSKTTKPKEKAKQNTEIFRPYKDPKDLRKEGTWRQKSETKKYPKISPTEKDLT